MQPTPQHPRPRPGGPIAGTVRVLAVLAVLAVLGAAAAAVHPVAAAGDSTWTPLAALPAAGDAPLSALAASPSDAQVVLAGTPAGALYRSTDGGRSWNLVRADPGHAVLAVAFNPQRAGVVFLGERGGGAFRSADSGASWAPAPGLEGRSVRSFAFARAVAFAGTDLGVFADRDPATAFSATGLRQVSVAALAVAAINDPVRVLAGGDASAGGEATPLFASPDGGATWQAAGGLTTSATMVAALAAGPVRVDTRPLVVGTNAGAYTSPDSGSTWQQLTGDGVLPATDFTSAAFNATHPERFYLASDGGASSRGGLWSTADSGQHFTSLAPPVASVTALAVSGDEQPVLYAATFRAADHLVLLWSYRDTGGQPQAAPAGSVPPVAIRSGPGPAAASPAREWAATLLGGPEAPFLVLGVAAVLVLLLALVAYARRGGSRL